MTTSRLQSGPPDDESARFDAAFLPRELTNRLREGGPEVDFPLLVDYVDGALPEAESRRIEQLIGTWRAWFDAFWEIVEVVDGPEDDSPDRNFELLGEYGAMLWKITAQLQPDGPPVDYAVLVDYVDGEIDDAGKRRVEQCVGAWRAWYNALIETMAACQEPGLTESQPAAQPSGEPQNSGSRENFEFLGEFGAQLRNVLSELRPDGPQVDYSLLVDYIDKKLDDPWRRHVEQNIGTWRAWYDAFWDTLAESGGDEPHGH